ncbi:hypothetical protein EZ216_19840 [Ramlibacter humi]|uniref:Uncharacterized protein n=1 Tax=Ramlibacter humi TaxID=2530451 RepID=A0A4Z0BDV1_9BURK|nr:hypothetical protein EZ216_19840 [Ramlibacter humi]
MGHAVGPVKGRQHTPASLKHVRPGRTDVLGRPGGRWFHKLPGWRSQRIEPFAQPGLHGRRELLAMPLKSKRLSLHWELMFTRSMFETPDMVRQHELLARVSSLVDEGVLRTTAGESFAASRPPTCNARTRSLKATGPRARWCWKVSEAAGTRAPASAGCLPRRRMRRPAAFDALHAPHRPNLLCPGTGLRGAACGGADCDGAARTHFARRLLGAEALADGVEGLRSGSRARSRRKAERAGAVRPGARPIGERVRSHECEVARFERRRGGPRAHAECPPRSRRAEGRCAAAGGKGGLPGRGG